jgi:hypothetical protein
MLCELIRKDHPFSEELPDPTRVLLVLVNQIILRHLFLFSDILPVISLEVNHIALFVVVQDE